MDDNTRETLLTEIGVPGEDWAKNEIQTQASGSEVEGVVSTLFDPVVRVFHDCLDLGWKAVRLGLKNLLPMLFIRWATGHWLDEHAADHGLARDLGRKTELTLIFTPDVIDQVVDVGTVFFTLGTDPKRFEVITKTTGAAIGTPFNIEVRALCPSLVELDTYGQPVTYLYSKAYNVPGNMPFDCEDATITFTAIDYNGPETIQGTDPEVDDTLRARIYDQKALKNLVPGLELYYQTLFKTVTGVSGATLDAVDPTIGQLSFTIYGTGGQVTQAILDECFALFQANKHETDHTILTSASPQAEVFNIPHIGGGTDAEIIALAGDYFNGVENLGVAGLARGANFWACNLHDYLQATWPTLKTNITPNNVALNANSYFAPTINPSPLVL